MIAFKYDGRYWDAATVARIASPCGDNMLCNSAAVVAAVLHAGGERPASAVRSAIRVVSLDVKETERLIERKCKCLKDATGARLAEWFGSVRAVLERLAKPKRPAELALTITAMIDPSKVSEYVIFDVDGLL